MNVFVLAVKYVFELRQRKRSCLLITVDRARTGVQQRTSKTLKKEVNARSRQPRTIDTLFFGQFIWEIDDVSVCNKVFASSNNEKGWRDKKMEHAQQKKSSCVAFYTLKICDHFQQNLDILNIFVKTLIWAIQPAYLAQLIEESSRHFKFGAVAATNAIDKCAFESALQFFSSFPFSLPPSPWKGNKSGEEAKKNLPERFAAKREREVRGVKVPLSAL